MISKRTAGTGKQQRSEDHQRPRVVVAFSFFLLFLLLSLQTMCETCTRDKGQPRATHKTPNAYAFSFHCSTFDFVLFLIYITSFQFRKLCQHRLFTHKPEPTNPHPYLQTSYHHPHSFFLPRDPRPCRLSALLPFVSDSTLQP